MKDKEVWIFAWIDCPTRPTVGYGDKSYKHLFWNVWIQR